CTANNPFVADQVERAAGKDGCIGRQTVIVPDLVHVAAAIIGLVDIEVYADLQRVTGLYRTTHRFFAEIDIAVAKLDHRGGLCKGHTAEGEDEDKSPYAPVKNCPADASGV